MIYRGGKRDRPREASNAGHCHSGAVAGPGADIERGICGDTKIGVAYPGIDEIRSTGLVMPVLNSNLK